MVTAIHIAYLYRFSCAKYKIVYYLRHRCSNNLHLLNTAATEATTYLLCGVKVKSAALVVAIKGGDKLPILSVRDE